MEILIQTDVDIEQGQTKNIGTKKQDIESEVQLQNTSETTFKLGIKESIEIEQQ